MECQLCHKKKLTSEYPSNPLSEACEHHHLLVCLRCIIKAVEDNYACPVVSCRTMIDPEDCIGMWECKAKLKQLTFDYSEREQGYVAAAAADAGDAASSSPIEVTLTTLLGESLKVSVAPARTPDALKEAVAQKWREHGSKAKVKLLFKGEELPDNQCLQAAGLGNGCRVQVLFVLQELTPDLTQVRVCVSWGWPGGRDPYDYLDSACLTFSTEGGRGGATFLHCIDFRTQRQTGRHEIGAAISRIYNDFVRHDGEAKKCPATRTSSSSFTVWPQNLDRLAAPVGSVQRMLNQKGARPTMLKVTHLFFVIFTFRDTDIERFRDPRLQVFDQRDPDTPLCSTDLQPRAKGLIVCLLSRPGRRGGNWQVTDVGQPLLEGSIRDYKSVVHECANILDRQQQL